MTKARRRLGVAATALSMLGICASGSSAADQKNIVGASCAPQTNVTAFWRSDKSFHSQAQELWVTCPILRDNTVNTTGLNDLDVYGSQAQFVSGSGCRARSLSVNGGGVHRNVWGNLPAFNSGSDRIDYGSSLNGGGANGIYTLECLLKARNDSSQLFGAQITQINITEP